MIEQDSSEQARPSTGASPADVRSAEPPEGADTPAHPVDAHVASAVSDLTDSGPDDLTPLFDDQQAKEIQQRWHEIQAGFVDDPQDAIRQAGALNDEIVSTLTSALESRRRTLQQGIAGGDTEQLRLGLRKYHNMLDQILTL